MPSILIAEPNDDLALLLERRLVALGHDVVRTRSGTAALDLIESGDVDMLIASVVLGGVDGIELVQRAEALGWLGPVHFITGFAAVSLKRGVGDPRTRTLARPIHLRELPDAVHAALGGRSAVGV